jgi:hypothetical protein
MLLTLTGMGELMTKKKHGIITQLRRNSVALISLVIAISSLGYNTWRNEESEDNRNQRFASFKILVKLNELQQVIFHNHYDKDSINKGNPRTGWAHVLTVRDFSRILPSPLPEAANELLIVWGDNWEDLSEKQENVELILSEIENVRNKSVKLLESLD